MLLIQSTHKHPVLQAEQLQKGKRLPFLGRAKFRNPTEEGIELFCTFGNWGWNFVPWNHYIVRGRGDGNWFMFAPDIFHQVFNVLKK